MKTIVDPGQNNLEIALIRWDWQEKFVKEKM